MSPQNGVIVLKFLVSDRRQNVSQKRLFVDSRNLCGKNDGNIFITTWNVFSRCLQRELCDELMSCPGTDNQ